MHKTANNNFGRISANTGELSRRMERAERQLANFGELSRRVGILANEIHHLRKQSESVYQELRILKEKPLKTLNTFLYAGLSALAAGVVSIIVSAVR